MARVTALALQPYGKILVAGTDPSINTGSNKVLLRFLADCAPETAFHVTPDEGVEKHRLPASAWLIPAGVLDTSFQSYNNSPHTMEVKRVAVLPEGSLLAVTHVSEGYRDASKITRLFVPPLRYPGGVKPLPRTIHGRKDPFTSTHWSVVLAAAHGENSHESETALAELCQTYWAPLYTFVRGRGYLPPDAQDLTQGFFAHLIEHRIYEHPDPAKGKFRSFLLAAMKNFLANARARDQAVKRGGGEIPLPLLEETVQAAERLYQWQPVLAADADQSFERNWAQALVDAAMARLSQAYGSEGKTPLFAALRPFIAGNAETLPTHEQMAATMGMPASTVRSHVTRLRARYREAIQAEVRRTVATEAEVRDELAALLRVLTRD